MTKNSLLILIVSIIALGSCKGKKTNYDSLLELNKFKVGQVWKYQNRQGEDSSTLTILKIEEYQTMFDTLNYTETIIHIRVDGIKILSQQSTSGFSNSIEHIPYSEKALSQSVITIVGEKKNLPEFTNEYERWKELYKKGKNLYCDVPVKEMITQIDSSRNAK